MVWAGAAAGLRPSRRPRHACPGAAGGHGPTGAACLCVFQTRLLQAPWGRWLRSQSSRRFPARPPADAASPGRPSRRAPRTALPHPGGLRPRRAPRSARTSAVPAPRPCPHLGRARGDPSPAAPRRTLRLGSARPGPASPRRPRRRVPPGPPSRSPAGSGRVRPGARQSWEEEKENV